MSKRVLQKQISQKKTCPIRWKVVLELRAIIDSHPGWNLEQLVFEMLRYRVDISDGVSTYEIALALYPNKVIKNDKGQIIGPSHEGICAAESTINRVRRWFKNECVAPFTKTNEKAESLIYNFQTQKEYSKRRLWNALAKDG